MFMLKVFSFYFEKSRIANQVESKKMTMSKKKMFLNILILIRFSLTFLHNNLL